MFKNIAIIGTGYVGLVSGTLLSEFGHQITCVDKNETKIKDLQQGLLPIFETGLEELVKKNVSLGRLEFTTDLKRAVENNDIIFIAVGTPSKEDGSADLTHVLGVANEIAAFMTSHKIIVNKSTVPIGTGQKLKDIIKKELIKRQIEVDFAVVSNPEFLREGSAVYDFTNPDRIVIGAESAAIFGIMREVYHGFYADEIPFVETNLETAEMIKYASNAFLATKITFINEIANLCEKVGANIKKVSKAMGLDKRISPSFLSAGPGYGGSCFPKDTKALLKIAKNNNEELSLVEATIFSNERQKIRMVEKISTSMGNDLTRKTFTVLGITFKAGTDDVRESPSLIILPELVKRGAHIKIFDPLGKKDGLVRLKHILPNLSWYENEYQAIEETDAIIILTEWDIFGNLDFKRIRTISSAKYFFDFRNIYNKNIIENYGFKYVGVGIK